MPVKYPNEEDLMSDDLLAIYLTDHFAGATAGCNRMRRLADSEQSADDGATLDAVATEIEQDRATLSDILQAAEVSPHWLKTATAWLGEQLGLLKTNGRLVRRSPLTSLVELEFMRMAVTGKIALWQTLERTDLRERFDFDELIERAERQLQVLQAAHESRVPVIASTRASAPAASPR
jgi:hypothetical protein